MILQLVGLTLLGVVAGVGAGYFVGAAAGMFIGPLIFLGLLRTETGGCTESNVIGGIVWLAAAGAAVGLCQHQQWPQGTQRTQRTRQALANRPGVWWALGSAAVWGWSRWPACAGRAARGP